MRTLPNAKVFHEPYSLPYFHTKPLPAINNTVENPAISYEEVGEMLKANYPGKDIVFAKNQSFAVEDDFKMFLDESFSGFTHSFLIRDPAKADFGVFPAWRHGQRSTDMAD